MVVKQDFNKIISIQIHQVNEVGHLVIMHYNGSQQKWQDLHWFFKVECHHKKWSLPNTFHEWNVHNVMGHEFFFFPPWQVLGLPSNPNNSWGPLLDGIHHRLGTFVWVFMSCGLRNAPQPIKRW
jgi:hypothetical protein